MQGCFVVHKITRNVSSIALDQAHEQVNAIVKEQRVAVGLTEYPGALMRWMVASPEVSRIFKEFASDTIYEGELEHKE